jgi:hypothetical protein
VLRSLLPAVRWQPSSFEVLRVADEFSSIPTPIEADRLARLRRNKRLLLWTSLLVEMLFGLGNYWLVSRNPGAILQQILMAGYYMFFVSHWVQWDAAERSYIRSFGLMWSVLFFSPIAVPWYFLATRGLVGGLKSSGLALLFLVCLLLSTLIGAIAGVFIFDFEKLLNSIKVAT